MCTCYYLHEHHFPPCGRPPTFVVHYAYCLAATPDLSSSDGSSPCENILFEPVFGVDIEDPCATGGCLVSPECSTGMCRLRDLGGLWVCCQCKRGGNVYRCCRHRMRGSPDTFCYHTVCVSCVADRPS